MAYIKRQFCITAPQSEWIHAEARRTGESENAIVRNALEQHLKSLGNPHIKREAQPGQEPAGAH